MNVLVRYKSIQRGIISIRLFLKEIKGETQVLIDEDFKEENKIKQCLFGCLKVRAWTQRIWRTNIEQDLDYSELKQCFSPLLLWILKNINFKTMNRIWRPMKKWIMISLYESILFELGNPRIKGNVWLSSWCIMAWFGISFEKQAHAEVKMCDKILG